MELLLSNDLGFPKGFNGYEWNTQISKIPKRRELEFYLSKDLPRK